MKAIFCAVLMAMVMLFAIGCGDSHHQPIGYGDLEVIIDTNASSAKIIAESNGIGVAIQKALTDPQWVTLCGRFKPMISSIHVLLYLNEILTSTPLDFTLTETPVGSGIWVGHFSGIQAGTYALLAEARDVNDWTLFEDLLTGPTDHVVIVAGATTAATVELRVVQWWGFQFSITNLPGTYTAKDYAIGVTYNGGTGGTTTATATYNPISGALEMLYVPAAPPAVSIEHAAWIPIDSTSATFIITDDAGAVQQFTISFDIFDLLDHGVIARDLSTTGSLTVGGSIHDGNPLGP